MGNLCTKSDQDFSSLEGQSREEQLLDSISLPTASLKKLNFLRKFEQKFNILQNIQLTDFMNALNNLKFDDSAEGKINRLLNFQNFKLCKDDWMKFAEYKILNFPSMPKLSGNARSLVLGYLDDVFDHLLMNYNYFNDSIDLIVPKTVFVAYAFNHCAMKISQKINIFFNLFVNRNNQIEFDNGIYVFLYCVALLAYDFPVVYLLKYALPENIKDDYGIESTNEYLFLQDKEVREKYLREYFVNEIKFIFGEGETRKYTKEEFKAFLTDMSDKGGYWLLDNNLIRSRIEKYIK